MKTKGKFPDDPIAEICGECRRRTVELTLEAIGIPIDATEDILEKVEILDHRAKILAAEKARIAGSKTYTIAQARNQLRKKI